MTDDRAEILAAIDRFVADYDAGDVDALLAIYADDLVKLRNGGAPETKADVGSRVRALLAHYHGKLDVVNDELEVAGDLAYTRGTLRIELTPVGGGEVVRVARRFLEIWRKRGGRWLVVRTMDNEGPG